MTDEMIQLNFQTLQLEVQKMQTLVTQYAATFSDTDFLILDWKSGKEEVLDNNISDQLKVYALKMLLKK